MRRDTLSHDRRQTTLLMACVGLLAIAAPPFTDTAFAQETVRQRPGPDLPAAHPGDAATAALDAPLPIDPEVRLGRLGNGLTYYIRRNTEPRKRAELRLVVDAGSVLEDDDQRGLAHFVEHMAFNGTEHFEKQELVDYLESIGMQFGPEINAYTNFDETVYMLTVPTDSATELETAFQILEDWAHGLTFDPEEVEKERGVVLEEWRLGQGAASRMRDEQFPVLFRGSKYAERLPIGLPEVIEGAPVEAIIRFYEDWYRPDLMAVVAVGDFEVDRIEELIRTYFSDIEVKADARPREVIEIPDNEQTLFAIATDPEATSTNFNVVHKLPPAGGSTHGDYRRQLVERFHNAMLNQRLFELTQSMDPPYINAFTARSRLVRSDESYLLGASVKEGEVPRGLETVLVESERAARFGFEASELEREKAAFLRGMERAWAERDKTNSALYAGEYTRTFLEAEPTPGIEYELALARRFVPGITDEEVNGVASAWLGERNRVVLVNSPDKEGLAVPTEDDLLTVFAGVSGLDLEPYHDAAATSDIVAVAPKPGTVVERSTIDEIGVTEWQLSNGAQVILKPTDFKDDQVLMSASSPGGTSLAPDVDYVSASWASTIVSMGGGGDLSMIDLQKKLADKVAGVRMSIGELQEGVAASASPQDLETMFQLVYMYFTAPRRDEIAYQSLVSRVESVIENRSASPEAAYGDTLAVTLSQHHYRRRPLTPALLEELDLDEAMAFYRDRFADAGDFTFVFVGNFEVDAIEPLIETWIASLPATGRQETWRDIGIEAPGGIVSRTVRRGVEPKGATAIIFQGPFEYSRDNQYVLGSMSDVLSTMLREVLREDLGGTYGVNVSGSGALEPREEYSVSIEFGGDPARLEELTRQTFAVIDSLQTSGASEENLLKVTEQQRRARETDLRENGFWLSYLGHAYRVGWDPRLILRYDELLDGLTAAAIGEAARKYIDLDHYVQVSLVPEGSP